MSHLTIRETVSHVECTFSHVLWNTRDWSEIPKKQWKKTATKQ